MKIWYPASGSRSYDDGSLNKVGGSVSYWSASANNYSANYMHFLNNDSFDPSRNFYLAVGLSAV